MTNHQFVQSNFISHGTKRHRS